MSDQPGGCPAPDCILLAGHTQPHQTDDPATWPTSMGLCTFCGGAMQQTGSCFTCRSCGETSGCG